MQTVNAWKQTADGKERSKLLTRKNKIDDRMKAGEPAGNAYLIVEEVERYQHIVNVSSQMCNTRDDLKAEKMKMKDKLDAYQRKHKLEPKSVHNEIECIASNNGLDHGATFGGKYNGKVARKVMENPEPIYDGIRNILLSNKAPHITNEYITTLCMKVVDVMRSWNKFFSLLQQKAPTEADRAIADEIAQSAVSKHVNLVKNATPKVHIAGVHAVDQYLRVRPGLVRLLIEHWVERNHQEGYKTEQQFRHEPKIERKAEFIAAKLQKKHNPEIQQQITQVNKSSKKKCTLLGKYTRKRPPAEAISPSPTKQPRTRRSSFELELDMCLPVTN